MIETVGWFRNGRQWVNEIWFPSVTNKLLEWSRPLVWFGNGPQIEIEIGFALRMIRVIITTFWTHFSFLWRFFLLLFLSTFYFLFSTPFFSVNFLWHSSIHFIFLICLFTCSIILIFFFLFFPNKFFSNVCTSKV